MMLNIYLSHPRNIYEAAYLISVFSTDHAAVADFSLVRVPTVLSAAGSVVEAVSEQRTPRTSGPLQTVLLSATLDDRVQKLAGKETSPGVG